MEKIPMTYVDDNRDDLLRIFSELYSSREIELEIGSIKEEELVSICCQQSINIHKNYKGNVDFPLPLMLNEDIETGLSSELESLIVCENDVKTGLLDRCGTRYVPKNLNLPEERRIKYGKFLAKSKE